jgi:hypothetical protein
VVDTHDDDLCTAVSETLTLRATRRRLPANCKLLRRQPSLWWCSMARACSTS